MAEAIRVVISGARGRVGREVVRAVDAAPDLALVGGLSRAPDATAELSEGRTLRLHTDVAALLAETRPDVLVDFTLPDAALPIARAALKARVATIVGTSGIGSAELEELRSAAEAAGVGVAVVPNFALGMVLATIRLLRGPTAQDRVLALDTLYINGMLTMLVFGIRSGTSVYFDIALLIALFGFVGSTAMARFLLRGEVIEP